MKKIFFIFSLFAFLSVAYAKVEDGFNANLSAGVGLRDIKSNISPLANSDYLNSYSSDNDDLSFTGFVGIELSYGGLFGNDMIYLKNHNGRNFSGLALGYEMGQNQFSTSIDFVTSLRESAYANPYLIGNREEIDVKKYGVKFTQNYYSDIGDFSGSYLFSIQDYEKDSVPYSSLKREGYYHGFELAYKNKLFNVGVHYDYNDADGKASSYTRYGFNAGINLAIQEYILSPNFAYAIQDASGTDPVFAAKQDANIYKIGVRVLKNRLLNYDKLYGFVNYGIEKRNNDINFYDETFQIFLVGLGYKF
ncbi:MULTISPECIES: DUF2860 family protein [unclassified Campylobacter]|uniref:DUF2860 family protein n=1 Tax=unclassified Campylobacter TaxID=2593542 RepID=UPI001237A311|nr:MULTISPECIES: DUF2860 family protein [unclassified Campylobacter]KAA6226428.1 DUF2860 domain-containing protein [Campylobacter sp. LR286c]KAA6226534.1 DUF2860 domain-containing protein [Campylobacter sp. LR185c]KAA6226916.1 DUF2860 domain-containing protein [Campylobacter sp. LR196d]KAA6233660.1 DUF2860 domain-containing protein [Campylobacter sp. LR291e]KAA6233880.1 DUF2860 domain-containing protein [Campylobacter sp. LR264d]